MKEWPARLLFCGLFPTYLTDSTCNHLYSLEVKGIVYLKAQSHCCMLAGMLTPRYPGLLVLVNHIHPISPSAVRCFIPLGVLAIHANLCLFRTLGYLLALHHIISSDR